MEPDEFEWKAAHFDRLCGSATIREAIAAQKPLTGLKDAWTVECKTFERTRQKYLLYPD